ncbi:hypothetical protein ACSYDW_07250 [Paeniglutamicibacter sp. R2-26]|uniref:hypothetical protein n=1 Tax=Paeniglutamicibacter sp. R2-26 TaxID=3144417 RepID=UPI003EE81A67
MVVLEPHDFEAKRQLLIFHCRDYHREYGTANDVEFDRFHREMERRLDRYLPAGLLEDVIDQLEVLARVQDNDPQLVQVTRDGTTNTRPEREAAEVDMLRLRARQVLEAPDSAGRVAA